MKLKGRISITRSSNNIITVEIVDVISGVHLVEAEMTPETFGFAVTGLSMLDCELKVGNLSRIGKTRETKEERVLFRYTPQRSHDSNLRRADELLAGYEVDGWVGNRDDMFNKNRYIGDGLYRVGFVRWV